MLYKEKKENKKKSYGTWGFFVVQDDFLRNDLSLKKQDFWFAESSVIFFFTTNNNNNNNHKIQLR